MIPMYKFEEMLVTQWFDMLTTNDDQKDPTYVYQLNASQDFAFDGQNKIAGIYYIRTDKESIEKLEPFCTVTKLSFSEMVYLSDVFSRALSPGEDEIKNLAAKGEAFRYLEDLEKDLPSTVGLKNLSEKIAVKYFDNSTMGFIRRIFSALNNIFRKYNLYLSTGIYWPGDSCTYAVKVVSRIDRILPTLVKTALEASKEILSKCLEITLEDLESMELGELKKNYHKKILTLHPDKNKDPKAQEKFEEINQVWGDYSHLINLNAELIEPKLIEDGDKELESPKEIKEDENLLQEPQKELTTHSMADID